MMEIVKIDGQPKEDGWYWFRGKSKDGVEECFDEPIYWECEVAFYNGTPDAHIRWGIDYYVYESGEFWRITRPNDA
jgi:hypothetical protein